MLLAAQSRALGRPQGAAVIVDFDAAGGPVVHEAVCLPPLVVAAPGGAIPNSGGPDVAMGYKVRFQAKVGTGQLTVSPWLSLVGGAPQVRDTAGQNERNTIVNPPAAGLEAVVVRRPVTGGKTLTVPKQLAFSRRNSGIGEDPVASHGLSSFDGKQTVAIVFDQVGRVTDVIANVLGSGPVESVSPGELVYFLIHQNDPAQTPAPDPLQSDTAVWVAINPQTGRINIASNKPGTLAVARENARKAITVGK